MKYLQIILIAGVWFGVAVSAATPGDEGGKDMAAGFVTPPESARPWVYWFPLDGNISRDGITADLEAMKRVGIGGVLYMETDQGAPKGPAKFAGPLWREPLPTHLQRSAPARPASEHEQRRRLVRQRRAVDHPGTLDAVHRVDRDERRRPTTV